MQPHLVKGNCVRTAFCRIAVIFLFLLIYKKIQIEKGATASCYKIRGFLLVDYRPKRVG